MGRLFASRGDKLFLLSIDNVAGTVTVQAMFRNPKTGAMTTLEVSQVGTANRVSNSANSDRRLEWDAECVGVSVGSTGIAQRGQFYCLVAVGGSVSGSFPLARGYVYTGHGLNLGDSVEPGPAGGHGQLRSIALGDPAVNTQIPAQTIPAGSIQLLRSLNCPETAGGAATRDWVVSYTDGTNIIGQVQEVSGTGAGITDNLMAMIAGASADLAALNQNYIALPMIYLPAGFTWQPVLNNIAAADNIGPSFASVEEWVTP